MKQHTWLIFILLIIPLLMACGSVGALRPATPTPQVPLDELLIDNTAYPRWNQPRPDERGGASDAILNDNNDLENIYRSFNYRGISSSYSIWRYRSEEDAEEQYRSLRNNYYGEEEHDQFQPEEIIYTSTVTSNTITFCNEMWDTTAVFCYTIGQYGVYVSKFATDVDHEYMTYEDLERILAEIDHTISVVVEEL